MADTYWKKTTLTKNVLFSYKFMVKKGAGYDYCLAFFFVYYNKIDEIRLWDKKESTFAVTDLPKDVFENKSIDQMKLYLETILRIEGKI